MSALSYQMPDARRLAEDARELKDELRDATWDMLNLLTRMLDLGLPRPAIWCALASLIEPIAALDATYNLKIEAIKEWFDPIDLHEARAMLDGLRVPL